MNYSPDHEKILGYLHEMREQVNELNEQEYNERSAFALNVLNRKLIDLQKAIQLLNYNIDPHIQKQNEINKVVTDCYRPIKERKLNRIDYRTVAYYKKGVKGIQRGVENLINLITRKGKNKLNALN